MNSQKILSSASVHVHSLIGHVSDVLTISEPSTPDAATNLAKIVSKLSPFIGNLIEFNTVEYLNNQQEYRDWGKWIRQDPGFPDTIFEGQITPTPGLEIKAWFPLATEITARFKDSQNYFTQDQTYVCILAWLPDKIIFGKPRIIDACVVSGRSVAEARDKHYHNPPDYLVLEPEDTTERTQNLQQTNTNGYKFQGTPEQLSQARKFIKRWKLKDLSYQTTPEYQAQIRQLFTAFPYRLDTNFAKIDRIMHSDIEDFKQRVLNQNLYGLTIQEWGRLLSKGSDYDKRQAFKNVVASQRKED